MSKRILPKVKEIFGDVNEIAGTDTPEPKSHRILDYLEGIADNTDKIAEGGGGTVSVDLSNYYNKDEADGRFAPIVHTHVVADITDLESWFTGKNVVTTTALTEALAKYYTKTDADGKFQTKAGMTDYVAKSEFASQLAAAGGYDSTNNPVATEEQITALFE